MILGIGVDILSLPRFTALLSRRTPGRISHKILHPLEMAQFDALEMERRGGYLAMRWAAKEAVYKAFYPGVQLRWKEIIVQKDGEKPGVTLELMDDRGMGAKDGIRGLAGVRDRFEVGKVNIHLSISHDAEILVAYVVAEHV